MQANGSDAVFPTRTGRAFVDERGLVRFVCEPGAELDEADAIANTEAILAAAAGGRHPLIVDMRQIKSIDAQARRYHAEVSGQQFTRVALLVGSPLSRVIGNFFLGLNRSRQLLELFSDEAAAVAWLEESVE